LSQKKLFNFVSGLLVSLVVFATTLGYLVNASHSNALPTDTPEVVFTAIDNAEILGKNQAKGKGVFEIGDFAMLHLTDETSELQLTKIGFDAATKTVAEIAGSVKRGSILAVNLLFGPRIQLADTNVTATNRGGSFILESQKTGSRVEVLSGSARVIVNSPNDENKKFEAVLTAGEKVILDKTRLENLFASSDALQQISAWKGIVEQSGNRFESENILISKLINSLPSSEVKTTFAKSLDAAEKYLLFSPRAKNNFYWQRIQEAFSRVVAGEKTALAAYFAQVPAEDQKILKTVAQAATPYTRIFIPGNLSPKTKSNVMRLSESFPQLAQLTEVADLDTEAALMRSLAFVATDPTNEKYAKAFEKVAAQGGVANQAEVTAQLLALIADNKKLGSEIWVANFQILNSALAKTDIGLATAIVDQLELTKILIRANHGSLGSEALQELASLIARSAEKFQPELLEKIAAQGNDLKNRIAFLASNHSAASDTFDEAGYKKWLAAQNGEVVAEDPNITPVTEIVVVEETTLPIEENEAREDTKNIVTTPAAVEETPIMDVIIPAKKTTEIVEPILETPAVVEEIPTIEVVAPEAEKQAEVTPSARVSRPTVELDKFLKILGE
jgi:hypothetical protein